MKAENLQVSRGEWGECRAYWYLKLNGYSILGCNERPVIGDRRLEIDIVAYDDDCDTLVFVEVKTHKKHTPHQRRLRSINKKKMRNLRIAFDAWRRHHRWECGYRFDVIEIYGGQEYGPTEIDHIKGVSIFTPRSRTVHWS